jgi:hypothetical protein
MNSMDMPIEPSAPPPKPRTFARLRRRMDGYESRPRIIAFVAAFLYAAVLWFNYKTFIHPEFAYMAFVFFRHSPAALGIDFFLSALPVLFLPIAIRRPSDLALILLFIIVYIPSIVLTTSAVDIVTKNIMELKLVMLATLGLLMWVAGGDQYRSAFFLISLKPKQMMLMFLGLAVVVVGVVGATYGYKLVLHNLKDVYTQRGAYEDELTDAGYNSYLVGLICNVLAPGMVAYGLVFKRYQYLAAGAFLAVYVFSITGLKSAVMATLYTCILFGGMTMFRRSFLTPALIATLSLQLIGMTLAGSNYGVLNSLFIRRTFMIQGLLTSYFYDYYSHSSFTYLSQSVLKAFMPLQTTANPEELIGQLYFHGAEHANASIWADGYLNAGFAGMAISAVVVGLFLRALNYSLSRADLRFACCALSMLFFMTTQTGIIKVLGTHGGLAACLLYCLGELRTPSAIARRNLSERAAARRAPKMQT